LQNTLATYRELGLIVFDWLKTKRLSLVTKEVGFGHKRKTEDYESPSLDIEIMKWIDLGSGPQTPLPILSGLSPLLAGNSFPLRSKEGNLKAFVTLP